MCQIIEGWASQSKLDSTSGGSFVQHNTLYLSGHEETQQKCKDCQNQQLVLLSCWLQRSMECYTDTWSWTDVWRGNLPVSAITNNDTNREITTSSMSHLRYYLMHAFHIGEERAIQRLP